MSIQSVNPLDSTPRKSRKPALEKYHDQMVEAGCRDKSPRRRGKVIVKAAHKRSVQQVMAAVAAGFLPVASYVIAHIEAVQDGKSYLYALVACALAYSAPTLAKWAEGWAGHVVKAWGFTILLECVSVLSHIQWLNLIGLTILVAINAVTAFNKAAK